MAVHDQEQDQTSDARRKRQPLGAWRDILGALAPVLALGAVVLYGYLSIAYDEFYRSLGVDRSDVGLSYTGVLARSSGFVVTYLILATLFALLVITMTLQLVYRQRRDPATTWWRAGGRLVAAMTTLPFLLFLTLAGPLQEADDAARAVRAGRPVIPVRDALRLPILAIRADPATVEPAGKPGDAPAVERLGRREVLYLGQASGTVVLYDPAAQQAVYVPASSIILRVTNCNAEPAPDPACRQLWRSDKRASSTRPRTSVGRAVLSRLLTQVSALGK